VGLENETLISHKSRWSDTISAAVWDSPIISLSTRSSNNILFLTFPRDQGITKENAKPSSWPLINRIPDPIDKDDEEEKGREVLEIVFHEDSEVYVEQQHNVQMMEHLQID